MVLGESTRIKNKPFTKIAKKELFLYGYETLSKAFDKVLLVCAAPLEERVASYGVDYATEDYNVGPLGGVIEGLNNLSSDYVFISGCDMPFLNERVIDLLKKKVRDDGAVFIHPNGRIEPLHLIVYRTRARKVLNEILPGEHRMRALFERLEVEYVPVGEAEKIDPKLMCFTNINTEEDVGWMKETLIKSPGDR